MAAFAIPSFDSHLCTDHMDSSHHNFSSFDDLFSVDSPAFLNNQHVRPGTSIPFPYDSISASAHGLPNTTHSANSAMTVSSAPDNFVFPQRPHIWLDASHSQKDGINDLDADFGLSAVTDSHVDYTFLAGENNGLLGVGECGTFSSSPASVAASQPCVSDTLFSSPSSCSSLQNFCLSEPMLADNGIAMTPRPSASFEGSSLSSNSQRGNRSSKGSEEPVFKAPIAPASAMSNSKPHGPSPKMRQPAMQTPFAGRRSSSRSSSSPSPNLRDASISSQDSLSNCNFSPCLNYLDKNSLPSGQFIPPQFSYPTMIQQYQNTVSPFGSMSPYPLGPVPQSQPQASPATSQNSSQLWTVSSHSHSQASSPFPVAQIPNYPTQSPLPHHPTRQLSTHSINSRHSQGSPRYSSVEVDEDGKERAQCPFPDCGKSFKDLKAHILTHQNERPEKCPITACEYHKRGFARKYDRNRHLVTTHYKATIVCGFCPGSGSSAEKSFNRTDVFKRHLVTVHHVEQHPSNSKKRTPQHSARQSPALPEDATGKCSTCSQIFATPQELFDHFDDCVLRVVTQTDPAEEANEKNLRSVAEDTEVKATLDRHLLNGSSSPSSVNGDTDEHSDEIDDVASVSTRNGRSGKGTIGAPRTQVNGNSLHTVTDGHVTKNANWGKNTKGRAGVTYSKGGVSLSVGKGRKKKKFYPQSWGCPVDQMKLKKRVLTVFDGQRRLWKDDMMLGDDVEVRMKLPNADDDSTYITDLDVETLKRAEGFFGATEEERGPWIPSNYAGDLAAELFQEQQLLHQQQQQQQQQLQLLPQHPRQPHQQ